MYHRLISCVIQQALKFVINLRCLASQKKKKNFTNNVLCRLMKLYVLKYLNFVLNISKGYMMMMMVRILKPLQK